MLSPYLGNESNRDGAIQADLGAGAPTVMAYARLCAAAALRDDPVGEADETDLSLEAKAILFAARKRGILELKPAPKEFDSAERFLTVYVEETPDRIRVFRDSGEPRRTIRFLEAFRQICRRGLAMHHLGGEFSLSERGFEMAALVSATEAEPLLERLRVVERDLT